LNTSTVLVHQISEVIVLILFHSREILTILNSLIDILKAALSKSVSLLTLILTSLESTIGLIF
jgi:hypothetical protein